MIDKFKQHLRASGQSITAPRLAIFEFLQAHDPATVAAVVDFQVETIDRASVYRTLALFRKLGIIQDIVAGGKRMIELTDTFDIHHHHIVCLGCGAMSSIADVAIEQRLNAIARAHGFEPQSHQIEVSGFCGSCRAVGPDK